MDIFFADKKRLPLSDILGIPQHKCLLCDQERKDNATINILAARDDFISSETFSEGTATYLRTHSQYSSFTHLSLLVCKECILKLVTKFIWSEFFSLLGLVSLFSFLILFISLVSNSNPSSALFTFNILLVCAPVLTGAIAFGFARKKIKQYTIEDATSVVKKEKILQWQPQTTLNEKLRLEIRPVLWANAKKQNVNWGDFKWWFEEEYKTRFEKRT
jgi:hypothetical protein